MEEGFIERYALEALYTLIMFLIGCLWKAIKNAREETREENRRAREDNRLIKEGLCALLKDKILQRYEKCTEGGYCSIELREDIEKMYTEYKAFGGNGVITNVMEKLRAMPTEPPEKKDE